MNCMGHHWFRYWLVACSAPSHYLKQYWILSIGLLRTNFRKIWIGILSSGKWIWKCHLPNWRPFGPGGDDLCLGKNHHFQPTISQVFLRNRSYCSYMQPRKFVTLPILWRLKCPCVRSVRVFVWFNCDKFLENPQMDIVWCIINW